MPHLEKDLAAFTKMKAELETHHLGKWVVFHDGALIDSFDTFDSAASEAVRRFGGGPYLIRQVGAPEFTLPASVVFHPLPRYA